MWAKIITIKRTKDLNYFSLCALNLFNTQVLQFELNYWNKLTFPQNSNLLRSACNSSHPQAIQNGNEFLSSSDFEKCSIASLAHQWIWMGTVRMRVKTADKNITIIHTTSVQQLTSCEAKSCVFVRNKSIKMKAFYSTVFLYKDDSSPHSFISSDSVGLTVCM